jgi:hypothetical protein
MINATERRVCFDARFYEEIMKIIVTLIALGAVVCGVTSAVYWLRSAFEEPPSTAMIATHLNDKSGRTPLDKWIEKVAKKNRWAAFWSACAPPGSPSA